MFLELLCVLLLLVTAVGIVPLVLSLQLRARITAWQELARQTGLTCEVKRFLGIPTSCQVVGVYQGYAIRLGAFTRRFYRTTVIYTFINLPVANPRQLHLVISEKGIISTLMRWTGSPEIALGDPALDQRCAFRGSDETALRQLFTAPEVRPALLRLRQFDYLEIKVQTLHFEQKGVATEVAYLTFLLELTTTLGRVFESR
jgi:hypothetical protein